MAQKLLAGGALCSRCPVCYGPKGGCPMEGGGARTRKRDRRAGERANNRNIRCLRSNRHPPAPSSARRPREARTAFQLRAVCMVCWARWLLGRRVRKLPCPSARSWLAGWLARAWRRRGDTRGPPSCCSRRRAKPSSRLEVAVSNDSLAPSTAGSCARALAWPTFEIIIMVAQ